jgi:hypothetical protein
MFSFTGIWLLGLTSWPNWLTVTPGKTESFHRRWQIVLEYVIGGGHRARKWLHPNEPPLTEMKFGYANTCNSKRNT